MLKLKSFVLAAVAAMGVSLAHAATIPLDFTTSVTGPGSSVVTSDGTLTLTGVSVSDNINTGMLAVEPFLDYSLNVNGTSTATLPLTGEAFTVAITQTQPGPGGNSFTGSVNGALIQSQSGLYLTFDQTSVVVGSTTIYFSPGLTFLHAGTNTPINGGVITTANAASTPVPASVLGGGALLTLLAVSKRRKAML